MQLCQPHLALGAHVFRGGGGGGGTIIGYEISDSEIYFVPYAGNAGKVTTKNSAGYCFFVKSP